ncbi:MAG: C39 family peptidase [Candidatus Bathyarchaeota archaeon]|uniref:C39 family peptidase n=1 Tax=Candidatus Bathycorpusculum sp. TaxID=2994959 RepID=UPI0028276DEF|nr:C39 family peptidase [Candidatus Termiticorpusculum sp.]MCL2258004.1 C39 family peptidase [Candidatus Termiticorpusculum sp.]MCL2291790.1 C39 family peptidase [Candidatus Termiticorpusculum sp.]
MLIIKQKQKEENLLKTGEKYLTLITIKHYHQPQEMYCVPTSVKMCIDYIKKTYNPKGLNNFSISKIAKITETKPLDGTPLAAVENINQHLTKTRPSIRFIYRQGSKPTDLEKELNQKQLPVIVYINPKENHNAKIIHAVVIVGYDSATHTIYYDDPLEDNETTAIQKLDIGTFNKCWGYENRWIQITVGKNQVPLTEYTNEEIIK